MPTLNVPLHRTRWRRLTLALLCFTSAGPLALACSAEDGDKDGTLIQDASAGSGGASKDAQPDKGSGGGSGLRDTGSEIARDADGTTDTAAEGASDTGPADAATDAVIVDARRDALTADDGPADAATDTVIVDARPDADAGVCTGPANPDASRDAPGPGTVTNLIGFTASEVVYSTWSDLNGYVPRGRHLELSLNESLGGCDLVVQGAERANTRRLVLGISRINYDTAGQLSSFFVPGAFPLDENIYDNDAGPFAARDAALMISVAHGSLYQTDAACHTTITRAQSGSLTLTAVTPTHATGRFTATFEDAGTLSGEFDADLCLDAERSDCPLSCVQ